MTSSPSPLRRRPLPAFGDRWVVWLLTALALVAVPVLAYVAVETRPSLTIVGLLVAGVVGVALVVSRPVAVVPAAWVLIVFVGVLRKILAGSSGHVQNDPLIALPFVLLLPFLVSRMWWVGRYRAHLWLCLVLAAIITGSLLVVTVQAVPDLVTLRAFVQEVVPPLCAVALVHPALRGSLRATMTTVRVTTLIAAIYGIVQFISPAAWDMRWLRNVVLDQDIQSFGVPEPQQFRLFGPMSSPLAFALVLSVGILCWLLSDARPLWRIGAIAILVVPLLLTQVRTSVFALALVLPVVALLHYRQRAVLPLILIGGAVAAIPLILQAVAPEIVNRFSLSDINADVSYNSRLRLLDTNADSVFGMGAGPGSSNSGSIVTDNGYLAVFIEFGLLGGAVFLALLLTALLRATGNALTSAGRAERVLPVGIVLLFLLSEASAPVIQGEQSLVFWVALAMVGVLKTQTPRTDGDRVRADVERSPAVQPVGAA